MDRFLAMQAFVRVAESGSFAAAARALGVSNPVVSERVRQLETLVRQQLFYRTTRSVVMTETGAEVFPVYAELVRKMDDIENLPSAASGSVTGKVRVASVIDFGLSHVAPALSRLAQDNATLKVELVLDNRLVNPLTEGFDVAVHFRHIETGKLKSRQLMSVENGYFAAPGYISRLGAPATPADLTAHRCIGYSFQASTDTWDTDLWLVSDGAERSSVQVNLDFMTNSGHVLKQLAIDGHGIAVLPLRRVADEVAQGRLVRVLPDFYPETLALSAVFPASHAETYKMRCLLEALEEMFDEPAAAIR